HALAQVPNFRSPVDSLEAIRAWLWVKGPDALLVEDGEEQGCPRHVHEDDVGSRLEGGQRVVVGRDRLERGFPRLIKEHPYAGRPSAHFDPSCQRYPRWPRPNGASTLRVGGFRPVRFHG